MRPVFFLVLAGACGARSELDAATAPGHAIHDAGSDAPAATPCAWNRPFATVSKLSGLGLGAEMRLSQDELTAYFYRNSDIYIATRSSISAQFGTPVVATDVSSPSFDADPFLSFDGLALYLNSDRPGALGASDIFVARRGNLAATFSAAVPVPNVNSTSYEGTPYVTNDGTELWLATSRNGSIDVYRALAEGDGFGIAQPVAGLNLPSSDDNNPVLMADGLTVFYSSNRSGAIRVYVAHRAAMNGAFDAPTPVNEINLTGTDYASWVSADGCRLYMTCGSPFALCLATRD